MTRSTIQTALLVFAVIFACFSLALWIEANLTMDHDAAVSAFLFSLMALVCGGVEWVLRWAPKQTENQE
ncbi:MAG: hypothetical protein KGI54_13725 [Pseudomonadota bacterium]|nr:hypothetical protein [Pseudomonadota bacterium]